MNWWKSNWWASNWWASNWWRGASTPTPTTTTTPATHGMIEGVGAKGGYTVVPQFVGPLKMGWRDNVSEVEVVEWPHVVAGIKRRARLQTLALIAAVIEEEESLL